MSRTYTASASLPATDGAGGDYGAAAGAAASAMAAVAVVGVVIAAKLIAIAADGVLALIEGARSAAHLPEIKATGRASTLTTRRFALPKLVADYMLKGEGMAGQDWKVGDVALELAENNKRQHLSGALFDSQGHFLFGLARVGSSMQVMVQGARGQAALDAAYRDAILSLGERELVINQGFKRGPTSQKGGLRRREYSRIQAGRQERYAFVEDPATGSITIEVLGVTASNDVRMGADCPPPPDFLRSLFNGSLHEAPYRGPNNRPIDPSGSGTAQNRQHQSTQRATTNDAR